MAVTTLCLFPIHIGVGGVRKIFNLKKKMTRCCAFPVTKRKDQKLLIAI